MEEETRILDEKYRILMEKEKELKQREDQLLQKCVQETLLKEVEPRPKSRIPMIAGSSLIVLLLLFFAWRCISIRK